MFNRLLGALKSQIERMHNERRNSSSGNGTEAEVEKPDIRHKGHVRQWSRALRPQPVRLEEPEGQETEPLTPAMPPDHTQEDRLEPHPKTRSKFWVANAPWSIRRDGISAALEFTRALIGYILYEQY
jgi:hypothetical protein